jgi:hypothetical protein
MMKEKINRWLIGAHNTFPITFKFVARGVISGGTLGFALSLGYSVLFGIPFALIGSFFFIFLDDKLNGIEKIGMGFLMIATVLVVLIVECVLPATAIGMVGGALTGFGVKIASRFRKLIPLQTELLSVLFWIPLTAIIANSVLPVIFLPASEDDFFKWLFIFVPSIIFVVAMAFVAKVSSSPFIKDAKQIA